MRRARQVEQRRARASRVGPSSQALPTDESAPGAVTQHDRVQLGHGSGGTLSVRLLREHFLPYFSNPALNELGDAAVVAVNARDIAISTDTFVVSPLEFPGGDIGSLAVHGTLNNLAMMGASPSYIAAAFVLEEGLSFEVLDRIVRSMAAAARRAGVSLVTGDTKVVERGKGDGIFINTTGVGILDSDFRPAPHRARPGDAVLVSGSVGRHGIAVLAAREGLRLDPPVLSDSANLFPLVERLRNSVSCDVHVLRDPARGGLVRALQEVAHASRASIVLEEQPLPIPQAVAEVCALRNLDPLHLASRGVLVAIVAGDAADRALDVMRKHPLGRDAVQIGSVVPAGGAAVLLLTRGGERRAVEMLPDDGLPRVC